MMEAIDIQSRVMDQQLVLLDINIQVVLSFNQGDNVAWMRHLDVYLL